jgi:hypothetical protein
MCDCPDHVLRLWERLVRDIARTLVDKRVKDGDKLRILVESAQAALMCAEDHLGKAMLRVNDRNLEKELVGAMAQVARAHKLINCVNEQKEQAAG